MQYYQTAYKTVQPVYSFEAPNEKLITEKAKLWAVVLSTLIHKNPRLGGTNYVQRL